MHQVYSGGNNRVVHCWDLRVSQLKAVQSFRHSDWVMIVEADETKAVRAADKAVFGRRTF